MKFLSGNAVRYNNRPYLYVVLNEDEQISALVSIGYWDVGWVYNIQSKDDVILDPLDSDCQCIYGGTTDLTPLAKQLGKYYEKVAVSRFSVVEKGKALKKMIACDEDIFTVSPRKAAVTRKKWYKARDVYNRLTVKADKDEQAVSAALKTIIGAYHGILLDPALQFSVDYEQGTIVNYEGSNYIVVGVDEFVARTFLLGPIDSGDVAKVIDCDNGTFFKTNSEYEYANWLLDEFEEPLRDYVGVLSLELQKRDNLLALRALRDETKAGVYSVEGSLVETYRKNYDYLMEEISKNELEMETLKNERQKKERIFLDGYKIWLSQLGD